MRNVTRFQTLLTVATLAFGATLAFADDGGGKGNGNGNGNGNAGEVRLRAKLAGPAIQNRTPEGSADFRMDDKGRTRFNAEAENVNLPSGTVLTVAIIHGTTSTTVGTITLSSSGFGELELESQNGAMVPAAQAGDMVTISNGATTIVAGVLGSV